MPNVLKTAQDERTKKRAESERLMTISTISFICKPSRPCSLAILWLSLNGSVYTFKVVFLVAWTPYALVSMYSAFVDADAITPLLGTIPAVCAKSSMLWTSVIFISSNKNIRRKLNSLLFDFKSSKSTAQLKLSKSKTVSKSNLF
jgi:hypothetical protein